jgi:nucleoside-diphosphate-sugar epimerase
MPAIPPFIREPLWDQFAALLPQPQATHPLGCHRPRIPDQAVFDNLLQVLVFGCGYRRIADATCSAATIRRRRDEWAAARLMQHLERIAHDAYDRMIGLPHAGLRHRRDRPPRLGRRPRTAPSWTRGRWPGPVRSVGGRPDRRRRRRAPRRPGRPGRLREAASAADGVIHLAFKHDAMRAGDYAGAVAADLAAVHAFADALAGTGKPLVGTSGTGMLSRAGLERAGAEEDVIAAGPRVDAENTVIGLADRGVRSSVVRLPPVVHSTLDKHGFIPTLIASARAAGRSGYLGDGANRWPAGHTLDAGLLYRLALEKAPAGSRLHAVGDEGIPVRQIAQTIGRHLGVPTSSIPAEQAEAQFGWLAPFITVDNPTSSARTQQLLEWKPTHPGLIADLDQGHYLTTA